ncbi:MAG: M3 family metallopeptidase [Candidatus Dependentiae bacterium]
MINNRIVFGLVAIALSVLFIVNILPGKSLMHVNSIKDIEQLFSKSPDQYRSQVQKYYEELKKTIAQIIAIPRHERTFANTALALDHALAFSNLAITRNILQVLDLTTTDKQMRETAQDLSVKIEAMYVDEIASNKALYQAFKDYVQHNATKEELTKEQRYYLDETMHSFQREGLELPDEKLEQVKQLKKELAALTIEYDSNIAKDATTIPATKEDLKGLPEDFINALKKTDDGKYLLTLDYPTYFTVMENSEVSETRKKMRSAFNNRAYPANKAILEKVIEKRDQLAKLLGYDSYANYDTSDQMVKNADRAYEFVSSIVTKAQDKARKEFENYTAKLPDSVTLDPQGRIYPWDEAYARNVYKKSYDIDELKIAEYFPMEKTVKGLFDIYQKFFDLVFVQKPISVWHEDVSVIEVSHKDGAFIGYLILDLHPRPNKYTHACEATIIPATYVNGKPNKAVSVVLANFPKSTPTKPSLLKRSDVKTFFHEFGHALHDLLGRSLLVTMAGTNVKRDFVELPSQMLENWLNDRQILKMVSSHYQTGEPLPDGTLDAIIKIKNLFSGTNTLVQMIYASLSLDYFKPGAQKDVDAIQRKIYESIRPYVVYDENDRSYASFGHLMGYGAKYYGYMWSNVFALDLFEQIKKAGLLNPEIGKKYVEAVIGRGGTADPDELLYDFLGRQPTEDAFLRDMGLKE